MKAVGSYPSIATGLAEFDDGSACASQYSSPANHSLVLQPACSRSRQVTPSIEGSSSLVTSTTTSLRWLPGGTNWFPGGPQPVTTGQARPARLSRSKRSELDCTTNCPQLGPDCISRQAQISAYPAGPGSVLYSGKGRLFEKAKLRLPKEHLLEVVGGQGYHDHDHDHDQDLAVV